MRFGKYRVRTGKEKTSVYYITDDNCEVFLKDFILRQNAIRVADGWSITRKRIPNLEW